LTAEGVESNPGPLSWSQFNKALKDKLGSDYDKEIEDVINQLKTDVIGFVGKKIISVMDLDAYLNSKDSKDAKQHLAKIGLFDQIKDIINSPQPGTSHLSLHFC
jgi:hypothetical protein